MLYGLNDINNQLSTIYNVNHFMIDKNFIMKEIDAVQ